jgi:hypothetical protein
VLARLPDHRRQYLSFEGKLSGGRGRVDRIESGTCEINHPRETVWQIRLLRSRPQHPPVTIWLELIGDQWTAQSGA